MDNQKTSPKKNTFGYEHTPKAYCHWRLSRSIPNGRHNPCKYRYCELVSYFESKHIG